MPSRRGATATRISTADVILFHEYVHHFMLQHFSVAYPAWFVEGYAELFSNTRFERDGTIVDRLLRRPSRASPLRADAVRTLADLMFPDIAAGWTWACSTPTPGS